MHVKPKTIVAIVLLAFVAGSVVYLIAKEAVQGEKPTGDSRRAPSKRQSTMPATASSGPAPVPRKVTAYYFHGNFRCANCRRIEAWTRETLEAAFAEDLRQGRLAWSRVNVQERGNEHFTQDFKLYTRSVVLVEFEGGQRKRYKNLQRIWRLLGNEQAFQEYIREEVSAFLKG